METSKKSRPFVMLALLIVLAAPGWASAQSSSAQAQVPQPAAGGVDWKGAGIGVATLVANVGYIPAKALYAILGGITGGAGYALTGGNSQTADTIWRSSLGGDYVLTPQMISGQAPIHFSGPTTTPPGLGAGPVSSATMASAPLAASAAPSASYGSSMNTAGSASTMNPSSAMGSANTTGSSGMGSSAMAGPPATAAPIGSTSITSEPADPGAGPIR